MPIEQLLAMYGYSGGGGGGAESRSSDSMSPSSQGQDTRSSSEEEILSNQVSHIEKFECHIRKRLELSTIECMQNILWGNFLLLK